jgi:murein L,D-transpeptidase YcbB/YkuD
MKHLFLSYARADLDLVDPIVRRIEEEGYEVWIDREDIRGGDPWQQSIVEAIDECDLCLVALSPRSTLSDNVRKELALADAKQKTILPLLIGVTEIPSGFQYQLAGLQHVDLTSNRDEGMGRLLAVLRERRLGALGVDFLAPRKQVEQTEASISEEIRTKRGQVYSQFAQRLWQMPPGLRLRQQQMYTLSHLDDMGLTLSQLKSALRTAGYDPGDLDAQFSSDLVTAVMRFQRDQGLEVDGIFGSVAYRKLAAILNKPS